MAYLNDLISKVERLDYEDVVGDAVAYSEDKLIELQRDQMLHGFNADGKRIGEYKSPNYRFIKERMNPLADGYVDLKRTGAFYNAITVSIIGDEIVFDSDDWKTNELVAKYDKNGPIFGLNDFYKKRYFDESFRVSFINHIKRMLWR